MKEEIRQILEAGGVLAKKEDKVEPTKNLQITPELAEFINSVVTAAVTASRQLNPIEQKKYDDEVAAQKRRDLSAISLAKIEEQAMRNKKYGCSHSRYPMAHGKLGGHGCPKGQGEWTTGGQMHGDGTATMVCGRCSWTWHWTPTPNEREYIEQSGMMGMAPPEESRLIKDAEGLPDFVDSPSPLTA